QNPLLLYLIYIKQTILFKKTYHLDQFINKSCKQPRNYTINGTTAQSKKSIKKQTALEKLATV
ncbi:hypothetical protein D2125_14875, partial [Listeria monocytogenes]|nr:hypothetical protein [Listeria monocytogenes]